MNSVGTVLLSIIMSSLFIVIIMLFRKLCRNRISMRLQYALWLLVALRLLVFPMPSVESDLSWMQYLQRYEEVVTQSATQVKIPYLSEVTAVSSTVSTTALSEENQETVVQTPQQVVKRSWEVSSVPLLWVIGEIIRLGWLVMFVFFVGYNIMFVRYLHKNRIPYEGCKARLKVYLVEHLPSPCLYGKSIYITPDVTTDEKKLQHVIAHEQGHFRQGDMLWSVVRCLCLIIYWWNPLVWIAAHLSKQDCELSCDEIAIKALGEEERIPYGETLLRLVCVRTSPKDFISISTTMTGSSKSMKQRIQRIAKQTQMVWWIAVLLICVCGFCFLGMSTKPRVENPTVALHDIAVSEFETRMFVTNYSDRYRLYLEQEQNGVSEALDNYYACFDDVATQECMEHLKEMNIPFLFDKVILESGGWIQEELGSEWNVVEDGSHRKFEKQITLQLGEEKYDLMVDGEVKVDLEENKVSAIGINPNCSFLQKLNELSKELQNEPQTIVAFEEASPLEEWAGDYVMTSQGDMFSPMLILQPDGTFSFGYDPLSSYLSYGTYEIKDQLVIAETMDGKYHYTFQILINEQLMFLPEQSSKIQLIDEEHSPTPPIEEWGAFQKE